MKKRKRLSGAAQIKAAGKVAVLLSVHEEKIKVIDLACAADGRSRANFIEHYGLAEALRAAERINESSR